LKICVIGVGKMGKIHLKYIKALGVNWCWLDPNVDSDPDAYSEYYRMYSLDDLNHLNVTHVIVATPESTHYTIMNQIMQADKTNNIKILVEKPAIIDREHMHIMDASNISTGMVERFNPAIQSLKKVIDVDAVLSIDFVRCSTMPVSNRNVSSLVDVGIHDIDLFCYLFPDEDVVEKKIMVNSDTYTLSLMTANNIIGRFIWSNETFYKERKVTVRQCDCGYSLDLIDQVVKQFSVSKDGTLANTVRDIYVEKKSPILSEIQAFINDEIVDARKSHALYFDILSALKLKQN